MPGQPGLEHVLEDGRERGLGLPADEFLLGLSCELRVFGFIGEHVVDSFPDVFRGDLDSPRQQAARFAELADRLRQSAAQGIDVRAACQGRNQVDVTLAQRGILLRGPADRPIDCLLTVFMGSGEWWLRQRVVSNRFTEILQEPVFELPSLGIIPRSVQCDFQTRAQHGLCAQ